MTTPIGVPKRVGKISQGSLPRRATWCIYKYVAIIVKERDREAIDMRERVVGGSQKELWEGSRWRNDVNKCPYEISIKKRELKRIVPTEIHRPPQKDLHAYPCGPHALNLFYKFPVEPCCKGRA